MKSFKSALIIIGLVLLVTSCQQPKEYKVGYLNLGALYQAEPQFRALDSVYQTQLGNLDNYAKGVDAKLRKSKAAKDVLEKEVKAYRDTIAAYKQNIEKEYSDKINVEKAKLQVLIDSASKGNNYNYVFSTANSNVLYAKDTTQNLTKEVLKMMQK